MLFNILKIVSFVRAVNYESFSKAALSMGISTPAVSKQIRDLENFLEVKLLTRSTRHVALTSPGKKAYSYFNDMLNDLNHLCNSFEKDNPNPYKKITKDKFLNIYKDIVDDGL